MSTPKPNHQWDVSRLYKNVRTRLRIQQIHMWSWSCDSKASIQMSGSSVQRITAKKNELLNSNQTWLLSYEIIRSSLALGLRSVTSHLSAPTQKLWLTGCKCLHPGQSLRKGYDWSGTFSWCHVLSLENSGTFLFTHVHWLQRSPNEVHWKTDFCLIAPLLISATVSTIDWSLLSIHIQCVSYCISPSINPTWNPNLTFVTVLVCL